MRRRTAAVIQARMGSVRFPGKMLARLGTHNVLEWVIFRLRRALTINQIVLATSILSRDDPLAELAVREGIVVYRGSEADVLGRFVCAGELVNADAIVRVCADNPFIDPVEVDRLVHFFQEHPVDYACNHQNRLDSGYADGFGAEILSSALLKRIAKASVDARHREHVTLFVWDNDSKYEIASIPAPAGLAYPELRFDVDTPDDLKNLQRLVDRGVSIGSTASEIIKIAIGTGISSHARGSVGQVRKNLE